MTGLTVISRLRTTDFWATFQGYGFRFESFFHKPDERKLSKKYFHFDIWPHMPHNPSTLPTRLRRLLASHINAYWMKFHYGFSIVLIDFQMLKTNVRFDIFQETNGFLMLNSSSLNPQLSDCGLQFEDDSMNDRFLRNFFTAILFTLRAFVRNLLRGSHRRWWPGIRTQAFVSNKPTHYILDYGDYWLKGIKS